MLQALAGSLQIYAILPSVSTPDPEAATEAFRERYLRVIRETASPHFWPEQRNNLSIVPAALGDLSQAIGAALVALYQSRS